MSINLVGLASGIVGTLIFVYCIAHNVPINGLYLFGSICVVIAWVAIVDDELSKRPK